MPTNNEGQPYRAIARQTIDPEAAREIFELTSELEQQARDMEQDK